MEFKLGKGREVWLPKLVGKVCKLFGQRLIMLSTFKISDGELAVSMHVNRNVKTAPNSDITKAFFDGLSRLQIEHMKNLLSEKVDGLKAQAAAQPTEPVIPVPQVSKQIN